MIKSIYFHTLYYASISFYEIYILIKGIFTLATHEHNLREKLENVIQRIYPESIAFSYSSARGAISSALSSIDIKPGEEVIISSYTCLAVPTAILNANAVPVYCDVCKTSLNMTVQGMLALVTEKTRAIIIQHTMGIVAPVAELKKALVKTNIVIIEDCALSVGSSSNAMPVGKIGNFSIFSMELSKTISCGWGGILVVNNKDFFESTRLEYDSIENLNKITRTRMLLQTVLSALFHLPFLYRPTSLLSACFFKFKIFQPSTPAIELKGETLKNFKSKLPPELLPLAIHQWKRIQVVSSSCSANGQELATFLKKLGFSSKSIYFNNEQSVSNRLPLLVHDKEKFIDFFYKEGFEIGVWFDGPLSPQPTTESFLYKNDNFPNANFLAKHIVNLPSNFRLNKKNLHDIKSILSRYVSKYSNELEFQNQLNELL